MGVFLNVLKIYIFFITDISFFVKVSKPVVSMFPSGSGSVQARGGLLQHERGDPVARLRLGLFRELWGCCHACPPPPGKMHQRDQQLQPQWRVHHRARPNRPGTFWAQLLQQRPFPRLYFWCDHWFVYSRVYNLCFFFFVMHGLFPVRFSVS